MHKATRQKIADTIQEYSAQPYTGTNIIFNIIKEAGYRLIDLDKLKPLSDEEIHKALLKIVLCLQTTLMSTEQYLKPQ